MMSPRPSGPAARMVGDVRAARESGAAMASTILAILLTATLSILVLGTIVSEVIPTAFLQTGSQTIFAAEAGIHAVLGQIRTAEAPPDFTGAIYGNPHDLPCTASGPVDGAGTTLTYEVTVQYFLEDPTSKSASWIAGHALACTPGAGPYQDPSYALITSSGVGEEVPGLGAAASDRTVQAVYQFQVTNNNIPGGLIYNQDSDASKTAKYCLEAEDAALGSYVRYVPLAVCGTNDDFQLWIYDSSYQLKLASSTIPSLSPDGTLCITGPVSGSPPQRVTLQKCTGAWNQLFSWKGGANFQGQQNPIANGYSGYYLSAGTTSGTIQSEPNGAYLWIASQVADQKQWVSFNPDPRVGAGAASYATHQIVNYLEFGRCFDVTNQSVSSTFLIVYPCKQDPVPGSPNLLWNHKFFYTEPAGELGSLGPQQIYFLYQNNASAKYCLVSPGTEDGRVSFTSACNSGSASQEWTRSANTGSYATSYTFVDSWGRCAALGPPDSSLPDWSVITTTTCNGTLGQKWNAPPNTITASVGGYQEIS